MHKKLIKIFIKLLLFFKLNIVELIHKLNFVGYQFGIMRNYFWWHG